MRGILRAIAGTIAGCAGGRCALADPARPGASRDAARRRGTGVRREHRARGLRFCGRFFGWRLKGKSKGKWQMANGKSDPAPLLIGEQPLSIEQVCEASFGQSQGQSQVALADAARLRIRRGRAHLEALLAGGERVYGVNTGVGGNIVFQLSPDQAELLQLNIMRHLSCATGQPLPSAMVRAAMLLRLATFATGCSAVRPELVDALADLFNRGVIPVVPRYGSVGASGDLMPSAYVARALIGMGEVDYQGRRMPAGEALNAAGLAPIAFAPKEGLALINGTTMMTAAAALLWVDLHRVLRALLAALALSLEAMQAPAEPYDPWVHAAKGHPGQIAVAPLIRDLLNAS